MKRIAPLSGTELEALTRLGQTVRLARLRRGMTQEELAQRVGAARRSVIALESGKPGVSIWVLLRTLTVMGYTDRLGELLASDPIGEDVELATGRQRSGTRRNVADF